MSEWFCGAGVAFDPQKVFTNSTVGNAKYILNAMLKSEGSTIPDSDARRIRRHFYFCLGLIHSLEYFDTEVASNVNVDDWLSRDGPPPNGAQCVHWFHEHGYPVPAYRFEGLHDVPIERPDHNWAYSMRFFYSARINIPKRVRFIGMRRANDMVAAIEGWHAETAENKKRICPVLLNQK